MILYVHRRPIIDLELTKQNNDQHICMAASMLAWKLAERMQAENLHFRGGMINIAFQEDVPPSLLSMWWLHSNVSGNSIAMICYVLDV